MGKRLTWLVCFSWLTNKYEAKETWNNYMAKKASREVMVSHGPRQRNLLLRNSIGLILGPSPVPQRHAASKGTLVQVSAINSHHTGVSSIFLAVSPVDKVKIERKIHTIL